MSKWMGPADFDQIVGDITVNLLEGESTEYDLDGVTLRATRSARETWHVTRLPQEGVPAKTTIIERRPGFWLRRYDVYEQVEDGSFEPWCFSSLRRERMVAGAVDYLLAP